MSGNIDPLIACDTGVLMLAISGGPQSLIHVSVQIVDPFIRSRIEHTLRRNPSIAVARQQPSHCTHPRHRMVDIVGPDAFRAKVDLRPSASRRATPHTVVMFNQPDDPRLHRAVSAGVRGLMLVGDPEEDVRRAIVAVALGGAWITSKLAPHILERASSLVPNLVDAPFGHLTRRETETVRLVVAGLSNAEIAAAHRVTESAVKFQVSSLLRKFGCSRRAQLAAALNGMSTSDKLSPVTGTG